MKEDLERLKDPAITLDHLIGMDFMLNLLSTSPRMHKPQMEVITEQREAVCKRIGQLMKRKKGA